MTAEERLGYAVRWLPRIPVLRAVLADQTAPAELRARAAVTLGSMGELIARVGEDAIADARRGGAA